MGIQRFIDLWKHRYNKYILQQYVPAWRFIQSYLLVRWVKLNNPKKQIIGVLLAEHFGDIVAAEPLSRIIKQKYPDSKVFWIVRKPFRELIDSNPNIDYTIEETNLYQSILTSRHHNFDIFYNLHMPELRLHIPTLTFLTNPYAEQLGIHVKNYFEFGNLLEVFAKVGGLPLSQETPKVYISENDKQKIDQQALPQKFVAIHCHSNFSPKDWQTYHWENLIQRLYTLSYHVVEVGLKSSLNQSLPGYINCCGKFSLLQTAEIIRRAQFFMGVDSGPAHLANAVGTYGLLLFGKFVHFDKYLPYSGGYATNNAIMITDGQKPCADLPFEVVWEVVEKHIQSTSKS
ncbi:glycosyltransferase family 9 protein [Flectobacillus roseus]|uniref:glycosyltransferase family 9 protein n=1 Tax=Flectobacillus roseus TaxID=502259 RepID=UPI0024B6BD39|nr:glycosyltransferase family 9 protein [Flectobacillus roseus]MDI9868821.1 glycosyltransferase family 9 protein [Flectobacillus roseus]